MPSRRKLLRGASSREPTVDKQIVTVASEFSAAIRLGAQHIEVRNHLDFSVFTSVVKELLWQPIPLSDTLTLRGNCSEPFPSNITDGLGGPPLLPRKLGQCLVVFFGNGLSVVSDTAQNLWIDGLYLRQSPLEDPPDTESTVLAIDRITFGAPLQHAPSVWMSNVTLQGGGGEDVKGLSVSSRVVAEGCTFSDLGGGVPAVEVAQSSSLSEDAGLTQATTAAFHHCDFVNNTITSPAQGVLEVQDYTATVLANCTFTSNFAPHTLHSKVSTRQQAAEIFSSSRGGGEVVWDNALMRYNPVSPLSTAEDSGFPLISFQDPVFTQLKLMQTRSSGGGVGGQEIAYIVAACVLGVLMCVVASCLWVRDGRRWRNPSYKDDMACSGSNCATSGTSRRIWSLTHITFPSSKSTSKRVTTDAEDDGDSPKPVVKAATFQSIYEDEIVDAGGYMGGYMAPRGAFRKGGLPPALARAEHTAPAGPPPTRIRPLDRPNSDHSRPPFADGVPLAFQPYGAHIPEQRRNSLGRTHASNTGAPMGQAQGEGGSAHDANNKNSFWGTFLSSKHRTHTNAAMGDLSGKLTSLGNSGVPVSTPATATTGKGRVLGSPGPSVPDVEEHAEVDQGLCMPPGSMHNNERDFLGTTVGTFDDFAAGKRLHHDAQGVDNDNKNVRHTNSRPQAASQSSGVERQASLASDDASEPDVEIRRPLPLVSHNKNYPVSHRMAPRDAFSTLTYVTDHAAGTLEAANTSSNATTTTEGPPATHDSSLQASPKFPAASLTSRSRLHSATTLPSTSLALGTVDHRNRSESSKLHPKVNGRAMLPTETAASASSARAILKIRSPFESIQPQRHTSFANSDRTVITAITREDWTVTDGDASESRGERMEELQAQLDALDGTQLLGELCLNSSRDARLVGDTTITAYAASRQDRRRYALRFFFCREAFDIETALYDDPTLAPLAAFLPPLNCIVRADFPSFEADVSDEIKAEREDGGDVSAASAPAFVDSAGAPVALPPCIVVEAGESLDMWAGGIEGQGIDTITGVQVLTHIAQRLTELHRAGFVHRDIKPANIMWLPSQKRWTIVDFGCVAETGRDVPLAFTTAYAPPEAIQAHMRGARSDVAAEAHDVWSLGVVAVEMLTGVTMLPPSTPPQDVLEMILGTTQAPWEHPSTRDALHRACGSLRGVILHMLSRDATARPTMSTVRRSCNAVLSLSGSRESSLVLTQDSSSRGSACI